MKIGRKTRNIKTSYYFVAVAVVVVVFVVVVEN